MRLQLERLTGLKNLLKHGETSPDLVLEEILDQPSISRKSLKIKEVEARGVEPLS